MERLPYRVTWGPYIILVERIPGAKQFEPQVRARILDPKARILKEIRDDTIVHVEFYEVTGRAPIELYIRSFSGSPHCCVTEFIFSRGGGLRNILIFNGEGNSSSFGEFKTSTGMAALKSSAVGNSARSPMPKAPRARLFLVGTESGSLT